jgi:hypothetical protein
MFFDGILKEKQSDPTLLFKITAKNKIVSVVEFVQSRDYRFGKRIHVRADYYDFISLAEKVLVYT